MREKESEIINNISSLRKPCKNEIQQPNNCKRYLVCLKKLEKEKAHNLNVSMGTKSEFDKGHKIKIFTGALN